RCVGMRQSSESPIADGSGGTRRSPRGGLSRQRRVARRGGRSPRPVGRPFQPPSEEALLELAVVLVLVLLNGVFALSELAVGSARRPRLRAMAEAGRPGAGAALA